MVPRSVGLYEVLILYNSVPDTTNATALSEENDHSPRMGPVPMVASKLRPGQRCKNPASLPPSGTASGNRFTILLSAALTLRATYELPKMLVLMIYSYYQLLGVLKWKLGNR
jgi:hypothetical protein